MSSLKPCMIHSTHRTIAWPEKFLSKNYSNLQIQLKKLYDSLSARVPGSATDKPTAVRLEQTPVHAYDYSLNLRYIHNRL